jgi:ribose/xylose/arabinose/galactoside ABC-type transport system permease subunit
VRRWREFGVAGILLLELALFAALLGGSFANLANAELILKYTAIFGISAIGAAMVIASGGIDLAPGAVIALASVVVGQLYVESGWPLPLATLAGLACGAASGALSAWLVVRVRLPAFIATLGMMGVARGLAFVITEGRFYDLSSHLPQRFAPLGIDLELWPALSMLLLAVLFHLVMTRTALGRHVLAVGGSELAARLAGVSIPRVKWFVYLTAGLLSALSGVLLAVVQGQGKADLATGYELDVIAAAVVGGASLSGGRASVAGAVVGALIFGVLRNALPQIPGGTFADRLILGVAVLAIVVLDRVATRERGSSM